MCILCVYTLLKVVSRYDLGVLSMSVMGFPIKSLDRGVGGWDEFCSVLFWIFLTLQSPKARWQESINCSFNEFWEIAFTKIYISDINKILNAAWITHMETISAMERKY